MVSIKLYLLPYCISVIIELPDSSAGDQVMMAVESSSMPAQPKIDDDNTENIGDMVTSHNTPLLYNSS